MAKQTTSHHILVLASRSIALNFAIAREFQKEGHRVSFLRRHDALVPHFEEIRGDYREYSVRSASQFQSLLESVGITAIYTGVASRHNIELFVDYEKHYTSRADNIEILGLKLSSIVRVANRNSFVTLLGELGLKHPKSRQSNHLPDMIKYANEIGYPLIIQPQVKETANHGVQVLNNQDDLVDYYETHPFRGQFLIEQSILGYKEIEIEAVRDQFGNALVVATMENLDPIGIHTANSVSVLPAQTLTDTESERLRTAAINLMDALKIVGRANFQFALDPESADFYVIEINPILTESLEFIEKTTAYPMIELMVATSLGKSLLEIPLPENPQLNAILPPSYDYLAVRMPEFESTTMTLGTKNMAIGQAFGIGRNFEAAFLKALRDSQRDDLHYQDLSQEDDAIVYDRLVRAKSDRMVYIIEAFRRGFDLEEVQSLTKISPYFLTKLRHIAGLKNALVRQIFDPELLLEAKTFGFSDEAIALAWSTTASEIKRRRNGHGFYPVYKGIDITGGTLSEQFDIFYESYESSDDFEEGYLPTLLVIDDSADDHLNEDFRRYMAQLKLPVCYLNKTYLGHDTTRIFEVATIEHIENAIQSLSPQAIIYLGANPEDVAPLTVGIETLWVTQLDDETRQFLQTFKA
jgi:carbamoyl-phosphate synthase large subunit